jgi:hypothetical protein
LLLDSGFTNIGLRVNADESAGAETSKVVRFSATEWWRVTAGLGGVNRVSPPSPLFIFLPQPSSQKVLRFCVDICLPLPPITAGAFHHLI